LCEERIDTMSPEQSNGASYACVLNVTRCGRICLGRRKINLSSVFAGQTIGIREVDNQIWLVSFLLNTATTGKRVRTMLKAISGRENVIGRGLADMSSGKTVRKRHRPGTSTTQPPNSRLIP
jgi:hypothetical protein